jgi:hypothetical protein
MRSLLALLDGRIDESVRIMDHADTSRDPEILVYFARHYARGKHSEKALHALHRAAQAGFVCPPITLRMDPWLNPLRKQRRYGPVTGVRGWCTAGKIAV